MFKVFTPSTITAGGVSTLTLTFANATASAVTLTAPFTDTFASGLVIANAPNVATTCGGLGAPTATPGGSSVTLPAGRIIPGGSGNVPGFCTLSVDVTASIAGCYVNTVPSGGLQTSGGNSTTPTAATLCANAAPVTTSSAIPTLSQWGLIALTLLLAFAGVKLLRTRKT
jgi:hypothetical protein